MAHSIFSRLSIIFFTVFLLFGFFSQTTAPVYAASQTKIRQKTLQGRKYVSMRDLSKHYGVNYKATGERVTLQGQIYRVVVFPGKRNAYVGTTPVVLSYPPLFSGSEVYLSYSDFAHTLEPMLRSRVLARQTIKTIVIDPGHGGREPGALGKRAKEKNITLEIARRLKRRLEKLGYRVYLTRSSDTQVPLPNRPALATKVKADLFIAIHNNASTDKTVEGLETFALTPLGAPSSYNTAVENGRVNGHRWNLNNQALAYEIQRNLYAAAGGVDRGVKRSRLVVLMEATCPAVLVEVNFISTPSEERKLMTSAYQEKVVDGIANGIASYKRRVAP